MDLIMENGTYTCGEYLVRVMNNNIRTKGDFSNFLNIVGDFFQLEYNLDKLWEDAKVLTSYENINMLSVYVGRSSYQHKNGLVMIRNPRVLGLPQSKKKLLTLNQVEVMMKTFDKKNSDMKIKQALLMGHTASVDVL